VTGPHNFHCPENKRTWCRGKQPHVFLHTLTDKGLFHSVAYSKSSMVFVLEFRTFFSED